jgi:CDP-diacylglycerol--serine O-phosphatidyltransferase
MQGRCVALRLAIPNAITFLVMYAGLTAIRCAIESRFALAVVALAVAGVADRLDGAAARVLRATSRFGAEFDSFADLISFGVAPALVMFLWALRPYGAWGYLPAVLCIACAALRLTRFNLASQAGSKPDYPCHFYTGMTSPPGAAIAVFPLLVALEAESNGWQEIADLAQAPLAAGVSLVFAGVLMISPLPLLDFVHVAIPWSAKLAVLAAFLAVMVVQPWLGLMALAPFALFMLAISPSALRRRRAAADEPARVNSGR